MDKVTLGLNEIIKELDQYKNYDSKVVDLILSKIEEIDKSWSGSIWGYQRNVYYKDFKEPPENAYFSTEWGIQLHPSMELFQQYASNYFSRDNYFSREGSIGDWVEYSDKEIGNFLLNGIDENNLLLFMGESEKVYRIFLQLKDKAMSLIYAFNIGELNPYLEKYVNEIEKLDSLKADNFCSIYITRFGKKLVTKDSKIKQPITVSPPLHIKLQSRIVQSLSEFDCIEKLESLLIKIQEHLSRCPSDMIKKEQAMSNHFNIQNMQGIIGSISGGNIQQNIQDGIHIEQGNFNELADFLSKNGIPSAELENLQNAINEDGQPTDKNFGEKVSAWIGSIITKASSGALDVSVGTIAGVLTNAISKYYGLI
ncbi:hypothetical protein [Neisseria weaveri]|uniref:hypothetical protein n=1 Tax=Neisseria weaveri TaxID=28091 RepID=UPI0002232C0D|nr:hypothetical protein [Neisseria weaveri]EGV35514.1 hypothetical protein l13_15310 [Neisseria weaveri ATCC 51223]